MKQWDAFISHASEDKDVVVDLAEALRGAGLKIWLDQQELRLGDSLREKIDEGLADSRFGIVVLSPSFLAKQWPKRELNGLMAVEESGRKVILPVWHKIDRETLLAYSPILADRLASDTGRGIPSVAADIIQVIIDPRSGSPAVESPSLARRFIEFLNSAPETDAIRKFLSAQAAIGERAVDGTLSHCAAQLGQTILDLCFLRIEGTTGTHKWLIVQLDSPSQHPFPNRSEAAASIRQKVADLEALRRWVSTNIQTARETIDQFNPSFLGFVVAGRRSMLAPGDVDVLRRYNEELFGITLRTYDWLVEAAVSLS
jgi:TIR domain